ncbi:MAG: bifunctional phosphopantothenoylcysteine decarboxylase/phosphopantothenate--cysteine ligase CoaBC [Thermoplasmatales archaeon]|nr:MAG: bifunctional phosphopantothenoylcysteine decarboxylase/phosphopantothenate--cysteine ligase CoaBC [Thermoplasmatales archaeon]
MISMHPADEILGAKSDKLSKKRIILGVTGSIAAVECIKLSRELIRHGAEVFPVMTSSATKIIHPDALWFATGNKPIIELTGDAEHVSYCGQVREPADLVLISPCTANTVSKIAHGIDDTPVTTFATTAIGSNIPMLIVPAMHLSMYKHKIVQNNIKICKQVGIKFIEPNVVGNKAKLANTEEIVAYALREAGNKDLENKKILIIGGATAEPIDDLRVITNRSSGKTAVNLAKNAFFRGADVELWYGFSKEPIPEYIDTLRFESIKDLFKLTKKFKKYNIIIVCAAISNYILDKKKGKISSKKDKLVLELNPAPKLISELRKKYPESKIIGFKAEEDVDELCEKAFDLLKKNKLDLMVANTISGFNSDENEIWILDKKGKKLHNKGKKENLADYILSSIK